MNVPTQAQIEAARLAIVKYFAERGHTFADSESACWGPSTLYPQQIAAAALTAAAEVGEQTHLVSEIHRQHKEIERLRAEKAATIERCAQVADELRLKYKTGLACDPAIDAVLEMIAARIRALKDKP